MLSFLVYTKNVPKRLSNWQNAFFNWQNAHIWQKWHKKMKTADKSLEQKIRNLKYFWYLWIADTSLKRLVFVKNLYGAVARDKIPLPHDATWGNTQKATKIWGCSGRWGMWQLCSISLSLIRTTATTYIMSKVLFRLSLLSAIFCHSKILL